MPNPLTWDDIKPGLIIRYEHVSRAKRLAGQRLTVRRGRVEAVYPPPRTRDGQISITVLNKDGTPNAGLGRISIFGLDFVLGVEAAPDSRPYLCDGIAVGDQGQPYAECGRPVSHEPHPLNATPTPDSSNLGNVNEGAPQPPGEHFNCQHDPKANYLGPLDTVICAPIPDGDPR